MARWKATYRRPNCLNDYLYFEAADARSTSDAAVRKAIDNAAKRAKERLVKQGIGDAEILALNCVG